MNGLKTLLFLTGFFAASTQAQLVVTISPPKVAGQKAVVPLQMKNEFSQKIGSARAAVFLLDEQGRIVAQSTKWVIGGTQDRPGLAPGATNSFFFVVTSDKPLPKAKLTIRLSFSRVVLESGKLADATKDVVISK